MADLPPDELRPILDLYGSPSPDPHAQDRVWRRIAAARRRRRLAWLSALSLATASALALTLVLVRGTPADTLPGRSILLAAATTAASGHEAAYWHIGKLHDGDRLTELWATRDGRAWTCSLDAAAAKETCSGRGRVVPVTGRAAFSMAGRDLTFQQIQALPSEAAALRQRVAALLPAGSADLLADALSGLLWSKPSPPAVRAAAYRALADLPGVRYLGGRADPRGRAGEAFAYDLPTGVRRTLIIDPATSQVLASTDGGTGHSEVVLTAGWTDQPPDLR